jgi:uncharacterized membrane protein
MSDISKVSENAIVTGSDGGKSMANLVYILYILGFFTCITALVGAVLAYSNKDSASDIYRAHFIHQLRIFKRGIQAGVGIFVLNILIAALAAVTMGLGLVLYLIPAGLGLWWLIWTILQIANGMKALGKGEAI